MSNKNVVSYHYSSWDSCGCGCCTMSESVFNVDYHDGRYEEFYVELVENEEEAVELMNRVFGADARDYVFDAKASRFY